MFPFCFHNNRTEDIPGGIHPRKVCCKAAKVIEPAVKMIHLPVVLQHADDIEPTIKDPFDKWFVGKPCVHEDVLCGDTGGKRFPDHGNGSIRLMHGCGYPCFVAICTPVNPGAGLFEALFPLCGWKHVEGNGDKAEAVRPSECKEVESPDAFADDMVKYKCQQFHGFAASPANNRIIKN